MMDDNSRLRNEFLNGEAGEVRYAQCAWAGKGTTVSIYLSHVQLLTAWGAADSDGIWNRISKTVAIC